MRSNLLSQCKQFIDVGALTGRRYGCSVPDRREVRWTVCKFSSHRMLSFFSMGTRVGLIFLLSAAVPLNLSRVQNFTAHNPSGNPAVVIARLECIKDSTGRVAFLGLPARSRLLLVMHFVNPDQFRSVPLIGELGRVVKHENKIVRCRLHAHAWIERGQTKCQLRLTR